MAGGQLGCATITRGLPRKPLCGPHLASAALGRAAGRAPLLSGTSRPAALRRKGLGNQGSLHFEGFARGRAATAPKASLPATAAAAAAVIFFAHMLTVGCSGHSPAPPSGAQPRTFSLGCRCLLQQRRLCLGHVPLHLLHLPPSRRQPGSRLCKVAVPQLLRLPRQLAVPQRGRHARHAPAEWQQTQRGPRLGKQIQARKSAAGPGCLHAGVHACTLAADSTRQEACLPAIWPQQVGQVVHSVQLLQRVRPHMLLVSLN